MSDKFSRAIRRHHAARLKRRTLNIMTKQWYCHSEEWARWAAIRRWNNMKNCSCWMCGNPRYGQKELTMAEYRMDECEQAQFVDYYLGLDDNTD